MLSFLKILKSFTICYHLFGFVSAFQQRRIIIAHRTAFRITYDSPNNTPQHSRTCLFEKGARACFAVGWNAKYQELLAFYKKHGHSRVGHRGTGSLYKWTRTQRQRRRGKEALIPLTLEQIQLLDDLNFEWDARAAKWNSMYQELADIYKQNGHFEVEYGGSLYYWIITQRKRREGTSVCGPLSDEQIQLLDEVNFAWDSHPYANKWNVKYQSYANKWNAKYEELADFYKQHGHLEVEYKGSLDRWMRYQRQRRKGTGTGGPLTDDQINLLDKLDFDWDPDLNKWRSKYDELADFYKQHGHFEVEYEGSLYNWIRMQRKRRRGVGSLGPITDEQIQLLDEVNFPWDPDPSADKWNAKYQELAYFYKEHGHLEVEYRGSLYFWIQRQRQGRKGTGNRGPLTDEQIKLLDELHFDWAPKPGVSRAHCAERR